MVTARVALASGALALLAGCGGAASNAEWVTTPESGAVIADTPVAFEHEASPSVAVSELEPTVGRPRLDHTVTLGEVIALPPSAAPASQAGGNSTTVIVNVNGAAQPAYAPYYGGYGALTWGDRGGGGRPAPHPAGASPVIPGQSWPAAPSYGPSFPYPTSPASPWETKR